MDQDLTDVENKNQLLKTFEDTGYSKAVVDVDCVLHEALMLLADKWTLPILLSLMQGPKRTSNLLREVNPVSPKMLVQTLKKLEDADLVERKVYPVVPPMVEYSLTSAGWGLNEALSKLFEWSVKKASAKNTDQSGANGI